MNFEKRVALNPYYNNRTLAFAGHISIAGAVSMLIGAAFWVASGTDVWQALSDGAMEDYLSQLPAVRSLLVVNTSFWILGVLLIATAASLMADAITSRQGLAQMGKLFSRTGASLGIVSFIMMLSVAIGNPPVDIATMTGWIGARLDDIATMLIVGFSPLCLSLAGKTEWVPRWLVVWGYVAGICGVLSIIALITGIVALGFIIIPFGIGWMIAAGTVLVKRSKVIAG